MDGIVPALALRLRGTNVRWFLAAGLVGLFISTAVSCRSPHSTSAQRGEADATPYGVEQRPRWREREFAQVSATIPVVPKAEMVNDNQLCASCHESYVKFHKTNIHHNQLCESCHGPGSEHMRSRGKEPGLILSFKKMSPAERSEACLKCHEENNCQPGKAWRSSAHANAGVACNDCHSAHYSVPPGTKVTDLTKADRYESEIKLVRLPAVGTEKESAAAADKAASQVTLAASMVAAGTEPAELDDAMIRANSHKLGALTPHICYRCHANMARQAEIAHPHQICGGTNLDCTTCHDPHGKVRPETRSDLCLKCHDMSTPTLAWHSSTHSRYGVACTDCHNPHPNSHVQPVLDIQHTHVDRKPRMPMSVDEPQACYKCHPDIYAKNAMPSHHPIKEGKMVCSDCHDPHGQTEDNLKEPTVNMVCYKCHAEKQGPFAYEHPPVTENCGICHEPHGTVANNLLHQPTTFLCLRCHTGHRTSPLGPNHAALLGDVGTNPGLQAAFYTDCTQCHSQIHGSDVPSPHAPNVFVR
jgi:DmsE family decaheme c-type cytochrome